MHVEESVEISASKAEVWSIITDIENCAANISAITAVKVLHQPDDGVVGLKWQETRVMFGKESSEVMWIVEAEPNEYYLTNSENHGTFYSSRLTLTSSDSMTILTMTFAGEAQSTTAKIMGGVMGVFMKGTMEKCVRQDLADIKAKAEAL